MHIHIYIYIYILIVQSQPYDVIIVQQYILFLSQLKVRDNNIFVNYTCKNTIIFIIIIFRFDISVPPHF